MEGVLTDSQQREKPWIPLLLGAIVALLLVAVVLIAMLLIRGDGEPAPAASPSPSETPSPSPSGASSPSPAESPSAAEAEPAEDPEPAAPADPPGPVFSSFSASPKKVSCPDEFGTGEVTVAWQGSGATSAWIGVATSNAKIAPYDSVPVSGEYTLPYPCGNESQAYTVTLEDADGRLTHKTATVTRAD